MSPTDPFVPLRRFRAYDLTRLFGRAPGRTATFRAAVVLGALAAPLLAFQVGAADFDVYRHGASVLVHGGSLYAPGFAASPANRLPFTYPPFAALAALVLLPLPESVTVEVWAVTTILLLAWCVRLAFRPLVERAAPRADLGLALLTAALLWTRPVFDHLGDGQVDILLMTLCLADTVTPNPRWPRGLLVGIATAIKLVPGIFIPYLWVVGRRRAALIAAGTFLTCEASAALFNIHDSHHYWTDVAFNTERPGDTAVYKNQSLRGLVFRSLPAPGRGCVLTAAVVLIVIAGLTRARRAHLGGHPVAGATLTGLTAVLASPVSWIHSTVWIIPATGVVLGCLAPAARIWIAATINAALAAGLPYVPNVVHGLPQPVVLLLQGSFGLICVGLVVALPVRSPPQRRLGP